MMNFDRHCSTPPKELQSFQQAGLYWVSPIKSFSQRIARRYENQKWVRFSRFIDICLPALFAFRSLLQRKPSFCADKEAGSKANCVLA